MAKTVIIRNARLEQFQGAPGKSMLIDFESHGSDDAEFFQLPGIFCKPQDGGQGVVLDCGGINIVIAGHDYKFNEDTEKGETLLYSYDASGVLKGKILINKDGDIVVNDGTDFAVRYSALETAFNQLKSDFDAHVHGGVLVGTASTGATTPSTADITGAKVEEILIP